MALVPRKPEVEAMMAAIEDEESLEKVAKVAFKTAFQLIQGRELWVIATDAKILYGPYESETAAYNALAMGKLEGFTDEEGIKAIRKEGGIPSLGGKATVLRLVGPLALQEKLEEQDLEAHRVAEKLCVTCDHKLLAHGINTRSSGCSVVGCKCAAPKKP